MKLPDLLKEIGVVADKENINAFVVGGFVRDALLGISDKDIDMVVDTFLHIIIHIKYALWLCRHEDWSKANC